MKAIDPGHLFSLRVLDGVPGEVTALAFVKRVGENYPGNNCSYAGTTLQEVLRACSSRLRYVHHQKPCDESRIAKRLIQEAILLLEQRAARLHGRSIPEDCNYAEFGPICNKCGHVGCKGECR